MLSILCFHLNAYVVLKQLNAGYGVGLRQRQPSLSIAYLKQYSHAECLYMERLRWIYYQKSCKHFISPKLLYRAPAVSCPYVSPSLYNQTLWACLLHLLACYCTILEVHTTNYVAYMDFIIAIKQKIVNSSESWEQMKIFLKIFSQDISHFWSEEG